MIYTVTFNPALDYVMNLKELQYKDINRTESEQLYYGGKGINVSVILSRLKVSVFLAFRLLHGALSVAVCSFLLRLFPQAVPTFLGKDTVLSYSYNSSLPLSLCLVAMCALLMLGNNFALSKRQKKKENGG